MAQEFSIEQEYGRFVPPIIQKEVKKAEEDAEIEFNSIEETEDGGAIVLLTDTPEEQTDFYDNLAETLPEKFLKGTATDLLALIEKDKEARKKRDEQYEEGIRRTGMGNDAPGGASFSGAAKTVHPIMAEACVDFASRAMKELFPPTGPVRTKIIGKATREKLERADRKRDFLNWQLTSQIENYRAELEQLLTQLPLGGGQYQKFWYDPVCKKIDTEFVPIDNIYLPYACTNFYTSPRVTHAQDITKFEYDKRVRTGLYRDVEVISPATIPEMTGAQEASNKVEGKEDSAYNEDGVRRVYEIRVMLSVDDDEITGGDVAPYLLTIDETTEKVLSLYRNWEEGDIKFKRLDWIVEWPFIPWRGAYPIGLPQLIGGLAAALTGSLRALLDSALINNSQALVKLKGVSKSLNGQSKSIDPTEMVELEGPVGVDDVRKLIMPLPYNPPSTVLFQMLDWLTNQAKGVVSTASEALSQATNSMPVGTALALIEQGSITYSAIHSRLHHAQAKALSIISRLNRQYLDEEQVVEELGGLVIRRSDFEDSLDIIPVSDPNIFSEAQRYAQVQAMLQLETVSPPNMFNQYAVRRRALSLMHVDDIDEVLPPPPTPKQINAVSENVATTYGQPIAVFPAQDHLAHIETHLKFITDANAGGNPLFSSSIMPIMEHIKQHITMFYAETVQNALQSGQVPTDGTDVRAQDNAIAVATTLAQQAMAELFQNFGPMMEQAMQAMQSQQKAQQAQIQDPAAQAMLQAALAETERKSKLDTETLKFKREQQQTDTGIELKKQQIEQQREMLNMQQAAYDKQNELKRQLAELEAKMRVEGEKALSKRQELAIKEQALALQRQVAMAEIEAGKADLKVAIWEAENKFKLEGTGLQLEALRTSVDQINTEKARQDEAAQRDVDENKTSEIAELRKELAALTAKVNKPRKITVKRNKAGKIEALEAGD